MKNGSFLYDLCIRNLQIYGQRAPQNVFAAAYVFAILPNCQHPKPNYVLKTCNTNVYSKDILTFGQKSSLPNVTFGSGKNMHQQKFILAKYLANAFFGLVISLLHFFFYILLIT